MAGSQIRSERISSDGGSGPMVARSGSRVRRTMGAVRLFGV
jgi:hypothetical protein